MKIGVWHIISDHWSTLYDDRTKKASYIDGILFYDVPVACGLAYDAFGPGLNPNIYYTSTSVFGIFAGLLLNVQVGLYNIFARERSLPTGDLEKVRVGQIAGVRDRLLRELNTTISYLILIAVLAIIVSLAFYQMTDPHAWSSGILVGIYVHFLLTFLMTIRRSYALFSQEYRRT